MTVKELGKKYHEIQAKAKELRVKLLPLLKELNGLAIPARDLKAIADEDNGLYGYDPILKRTMEKGWNIDILFRLADIVEWAERGSEIVDNILYNTIHTPFRCRRRKV